MKAGLPFARDVVLRQYPWNSATRRAVLPALTGLGADGFGEPAVLEPAFRTAMLICAVLLALGGAVAGLAIRPLPAPLTATALSLKSNPRVAIISAAKYTVPYPVASGRIKLPPQPRPLPVSTPVNSFLSFLYMPKR